MFKLFSTPPSSPMLRISGCHGCDGSDRIRNVSRHQDKMAFTVTNRKTETSLTQSVRVVSIVWYPTCRFRSGQGTSRSGRQPPLSDTEGFQPVNLQLKVERFVTSLPPFFCLPATQAFWFAAEPVIAYIITGHIFIPMDHCLPKLLKDLTDQNTYTRTYLLKSQLIFPLRNILVSVLFGCAFRVSAN